MKKTRTFDTEEEARKWMEKVEEDLPTGARIRGPYVHVRQGEPDEVSVEIDYDGDSPPG